MFDLRGEYSPTELGENVLASFWSNNCLMSSGVPSASATVVPKLHCGSTMPYARNTVLVCLYKIKSISIIHVNMQLLKTTYNPNVRSGNKRENMFQRALCAPGWKKDYLTAHQALDREVNGLTANMPNETIMPSQGLCLEFHWMNGEDTFCTVTEWNVLFCFPFFLAWQHHLFINTSLEWQCSDDVLI